MFLLTTVDTRLYLMDLLWTHGEI